MDTAPRRLRGTVTAPALVLFAFLTGHAILETARDALFLARLGAHRLAFAYLAMAGLAVLTVAIARGRRARPAPHLHLARVLAVGSIGTAAIAALLPVATAATFALYVWTGLVATAVLPAFWAVVDRSLAFSDAKRAVARIGAGGSLGSLAGSALAAVLSRLVPPGYLVTVGALVFAGAGTLAALTLRGGAAPAGLATHRRSAAPLARGARRYLQLLLAVGLAATMALTFGDITFKRVLGEHFAAAQLATVLGTAYTGLAVVALIVQLVVTPRLLARRSVGDALMLLPALVAVAAGSFVLTGAFLAIVGLKLADGGLRHSLHRVASEILYLPVPAEVRDAIRPTIDAVAQRGGQAAAALLVVAVTAAVDDSRALALVAALLSLAWLGLVVAARRGYVARLREQLRAGEVHRDARVPALDADAIALLTESLSRPDAMEAETALDILAAGGVPVPIRLLGHPEPAVVRRALMLIDTDSRPELLRAAALLHHHPDPEIRSRALAAASRTGVHTHQVVAGLLDQDVQVRAVAAVILTDHAAHRDAAAQTFASLTAGDCDDRIALTRAIGFRPVARFGPLLRDLVASGSEPLTREALRVLTRAPGLADLEQLLHLLASPRLRGDVRRVFTAAGDRGHAHLVDALDDPRLPLDVRRHVPRTLSQFRSATATRALLARLPREPDGVTEFKILRALGRLRADDPRLPVDARIVRRYAQRSLADAARYATLQDQVAVLDVADGGAGRGLLLELLAEKRRHGIEHVFRALAILQPRADLRSVHDAATSADRERRAAAREVVEGTVSSDLRVPLLALLDDLDPAARRARLGLLAAPLYGTSTALVVGLLGDTSESLRCVAAHYAASSGLTAVRPHLARLRPLTGPPLVTFAFDQAIERLTTEPPRETS